MDPYGRSLTKANYLPIVTVIILMIMVFPTDAFTQIQVKLSSFEGALTSITDNKATVETEYLPMQVFLLWPPPLMLVILKMLIKRNWN